MTLATSVSPASPQGRRSRSRLMMPEVPATSLPGLTPNPLSLESLGAGGLALGRIPLVYSQEQVDAAALRTIGHLFEAGLLPPLPPKRQESLGCYLQRVGKAARPEDMPLDLQVYRKRTEFMYTPDEQPGRLLLTLSAGAHESTNSVTCCLFASEANRIHPRFFGSLMVHLSSITEIFWPVYTVRDALICAANWRYRSADDFGFGEFWTHQHQQLEKDQGRRASNEELKKHLKLLGVTPPRQLFRNIGMNEVLPALKERLCLSLEELELLAQRSGYVWVIRVMEQLRELERLQRTLWAEQTDDESDLQLANGETRIRPVYTLTAQKTQRNWTEVDELATEEEQIIEGGDGYREPFTLLIHDEPSAHHAARYLKAMRLMLDATSDLVMDLAD